MSDAGQAFQVLPLENGLVELRFDLPGESVNKFNAVALASLKAAVGDLASRKGLRGVLLTSGKDVFCVGADITRVPGALQEERGRPHALDPGDRRGLLGSRRPGRAFGGRDQRGLRGRRLRARA